MAATNDWSLVRLRLDDAKLVELLRDRLRPASGTFLWLFLESAELSEFARAELNGNQLDRLATCWQVRLFGADFEVAARRWDFERGEPWLVRVVEQRPAMQLNQAPTVTHTESPATTNTESTSQNTESTAATNAESLGAPRSRSALLRAISKQFGAGCLNYPIADGTESGGRIAVLQMNEFDLKAGESIVCWSSIRIESE